MFHVFCECRQGNVGVRNGLSGANCLTHCNGAIHLLDTIQNSVIYSYDGLVLSFCLIGEECENPSNGWGSEGKDM